MMEENREENSAKAPPSGERDVKFIVGMVILIAVMVFIGGNFWRIVAINAEKDKEAERLRREQAVEAIVLTYGEMLKKTVFVDMETDQIFSCEVPREGIFNRNGVLIRGDVLDYGDMVRIYGDGEMKGEEPPYELGGIEKMERIGRATLDVAKEYQDIVDERLGEG